LMRLGRRRRPQRDVNLAARSSRLIWIRFRRNGSIAAYIKRRVHVKLCKAPTTMAHSILRLQGEHRVPMSRDCLRCRKRSRNVNFKLDRCTRVGRVAARSDFLRHRSRRAFLVMIDTHSRASRVFSGQCRWRRWWCSNIWFGARFVS
jgi:hypothetical protein